MWWRFYSDSNGQGSIVPTWEIVIENISGFKDHWKILIEFWKHLRNSKCFTHIAVYCEINNQIWTVINKITDFYMKPNVLPTKSVKSTVSLRKYVKINKVILKIQTNSSVTALFSPVKSFDSALAGLSSAFCTPLTISESLSSTKNPASWSIGWKFDSRSDHFRDSLYDLLQRFHRLFGDRFSCWDYGEIW